MGKNKPFLDDPVSEERFLSALERIAMCLELMAGLGRPDGAPLEAFEGPEGSFSSVSYLNDEDEAKKEAARDAYYQRTGQRLPEGALPPAPDGAFPHSA